MDIFALLLCIQLNEEFRKLMTLTIKIPVLDLYHDRISMTLWPKLTQLFQHYIDTLNRASPQNFKQNPQPVLHSLTQKYVQFSSGVYQLCHNLYSNSQDMVQHRLKALRVALTAMLDKMAVANYSGRLQEVFRINNFNYIVCQFKTIKEHPILKQDLKVFEDSQETYVGSFISLTLKEHFPAMMSALDSDSANAKLLEQAVSDFAFCYKQKAELIGKELKNSV